MRRRWLVPEVIQTSAMDCGPAAIKALFGGYGVHLSYGRLREACQTDIDGTSVSTLEETAGMLGMPTTQMMLPADCLLLKGAACLPAVAVVALPDGGTHMVVVWRAHGGWVQVMDPAAGRLWLPRQRFLASLYAHEQSVPLDAYRAWTESPKFRSLLEERHTALGVPFIAWPDPTQQDAALRLAGELAGRGHLRRGAEATRFLALCAARPEAMPREYQSASAGLERSGMVTLRGAVLLRGAPPQPLLGNIPDSLRRVRTRAQPKPWALPLALLRAGGWGLPALVIAALAAATIGSVLEALLFRGLIDLARHLPSTAPRLAAMAALLLFLGVQLALEWPGWSGVSRIGRHLELGLRRAILRKIPLLDDRYFQSRLISDMAYRAHSLQLVRQLPDLVAQGLQQVVNLLATGLAIAWLYPGSGGLAALAVLSACLVPSVFLAPMTERDLRSREISGALSTVYLDALLGSRAIQAHGAQANIRHLHAGLLARWADAGLRQQTLVLVADGLQLLLTYGCVVALVMHSINAGQGPAGVLLLAFWATGIPLLGQSLGGVCRALPGLRNTLLRILEPLEAPEEPVPAPVQRPDVAAGVSICFAGADVVAAGHRVLDAIDLSIAPGEHVALVGISGAGKSTLLGCLLGWHRLHDGSLRVDGLELDAAGLAQLRHQTAWIDPQVHLFDDTLHANLEFGNEDGAVLSVSEALAHNDLGPLLTRLPEGLQTGLGELGRRLSGGEGQRVRAARAFRRRQVRLALLDEPTRGLGREQRREWLATARRRFAGATLLCVSHDVADTLDFDRVVVIEQGRILEQGPPRELRADGTSRYAQLIGNEIEAARLWADTRWRRLQLQAGAMIETPRRAPHRMPA